MMVFVSGPSLGPENLDKQVSRAARNAVEESETRRCGRIVGYTELGPKRASSRRSGLLVSLQDFACLRSALERKVYQELAILCLISIRMVRGGE